MIHARRPPPGRSRRAPRALDAVLGSRHSLRSPSTRSLRARSFSHHQRSPMATLRGSLVRCLAVSVAAAASAVAGTIHVPGDAPTIQQGIALAANGDTVLVAPGQYLEKIDFLGKRLVVRSEAGPVATTINAFLAGGSVVTVKSGEPFGTELRGFELKGGAGQIVQVSGQPFRAGGGLLVDNQSNLLVQDCFISDNDLLSFPDLS